MRQSKKEIKDGEVIMDLLKTCHVGRLGTIGSDGYPVVKPLNFVWDEGVIYFHTALAGEKMEDIKRDSRVCFEIDLPIAYVKGDKSPCRAEYLFRSVIIKGRAGLVDNADEKLKALRCLMNKYQPESAYADFPQDKLAITGVVKIVIEEMAGKEDLGNDSLREAALKALRDGVPLPIVLERT
ncbi:MAG: pyridoxamine 5'-phosphate oxidase family protein [Nitrospirae bacterium]|nr:pyridoxamine 5'-phosphate oxidase family protein [Nitrospirota bacterium]